MMSSYKTNENGDSVKIDKRQKLILRLDAMSNYFNNQITFSEPTPDYTAHNNQMDSFINDIDLIRQELLKEASQ